LNTSVEPSETFFLHGWQVSMTQMIGLYRSDYMFL
jgi:hypothetical protein